MRHDKAVLHPIRQMEHLKVVPEYLVPLSMRGITSGSNSNTNSKGSGSGSDKKNNKRNRQDSNASYNDNSAANKMQKSKMKDPLYGGGDDNSNSGNTNSNSNDGDDEFNVAGRNAWKIRHNKGKYNPKNPQGNSTTGNFIAGKGRKGFQGKK